MKSNLKRLTSTIFWSILVYSIVVVLCFGSLFSALFYFTHENEAESNLSSIASSAAHFLEGKDRQNIIEILQDQMYDGVRYTLIAADGEVLFDTEGTVQVNHADRPEFQNAKTDGSSSVMRYSETLGKDTIYAAQLLDSGMVLRVSEDRASYFAVLQTILVPLIGALILVIVISVVFSRLLTKRILAPLDNIDVSRPLENKTYQELMPLLTRIDEQRRQLTEQNQELARAEGLRRQFSANVSHEMKTPLQVISGYAELLEKGDVPLEDAQKFAGIILQESQNMAALIDDVLVLSRLDDPVLENAGKEPIELLSLCKDAADRLGPLANKHEIRLCVFGSSVAIEGNYKLLLQLVTNLISNAIRYSPRMNEVRIVVGKTLVENDIDNPVSTPEAFIRVKDSGCGIALNEQEKIFERFYRVDKSRSKETGGTGLGLAIAKHAAEFHNATITLDSKLGEGSTFTVHFPMR